MESTNLSLLGSDLSLLKVALSLEYPMILNLSMPMFYGELCPKKAHKFFFKKPVVLHLLFVNKLQRLSI